MAENKDLLDMLVERTAKLYASASSMKEAEAQLKRMEERDNAVSPSNTNGDMTPDE